MHVVIADQLSSSAIEILRTVPGFTVDARPQRPAAELAKDLADADALIVRSATQVDAKLIAAAPRLRVIARAGTGVDNVDVAAATDRGIVVMNAPGANSVSVAEHAWALMLALSRSVAAADAAMKRGVWDKKRLTGAELRGKTLGVVGLGRIGQEVTNRARAFGMHVLAHDPFISEQVAATMGAELRAARRSLRALGLHHAAHSGDRGDQEPVRRGADCGVQARRAHHQYRARRAD